MFCDFMLVSCLNRLLLAHAVLCKVVLRQKVKSLPTVRNKAENEPSGEEVNQHLKSQATEQAGCSASTLPLATQDKTPVSTDVPDLLTSSPSRTVQLNNPTVSINNRVSVRPRYGYGGIGASNFPTKNWM